MSLIWHFYWPAFLAAFFIGVLAGRIGFFQPKIEDEAPEAKKVGILHACRIRRTKSLIAGVLAVLAVNALWHWPARAGNRFAVTVDRIVAEELQRLEMPEISAKVVRSPVRRTLILSGPANDFQQAEFVRIMETAPGVASARWGARTGLELPLVIETILFSLLAFLAGLFLSYLVEIRRRVNSEWSW
jgi:hypothetical protein